MANEIKVKMRLVVPGFAEMRYYDLDCHAFPKLGLHFPITHADQICAPLSVG